MSWSQLSTHHVISADELNRFVADFFADELRAGDVVYATARINIGQGDCVYPDPVTAGVFHRLPVGSSGRALRFSGEGPRLVDAPVLPDWWRCDACGHANAFKIKGELQLSCPHCGAQMPKRYDP